MTSLYRPFTRMYSYFDNYLGYYGLGKDIPPDSLQGERMALLQEKSPGALIRTNWDYEIID